MFYVDALIGADTVTTIPPKTIDAFRDHGAVADTLTADVDEARRVLADAERLGLALDDTTDRLVREGVASFAKSFDDLLAAIGRKQPTSADTP